MEPDVNIPVDSIVDNPSRKRKFQNWMMFWILNYKQLLHQEYVLFEHQNASKNLQCTGKLKNKNIEDTVVDYLIVMSYRIHRLFFSR